MHHISNKKGLLALSPLIVFIVMYLVTSIIAGDFKKIPITVAFMISSMYAIATSTGKPLVERINVFSKGAGTSNMMLMLWIFVLAGAFANSAKQMGSIDAMVGFTLNALPSTLSHISFHRNQRWNHRCPHTHCRGHSPKHRYQSSVNDRNSGGRFVFWRQPFVYFRHHRSRNQHTRLPNERQVLG